MIADVDRRIRAHPMHRVRTELDGLAEMLRFVLSPNGQELVALLRRASTDPETFISLAPAQQYSGGALRFRADLARHLHNYLASAYSLRERAGEAIEGRERHAPMNEDGLRQEWNRRASEFENDPGMAFVMGLRTYVQHYGQLPIGHRLHVNVVESTAESELTITMSELEAPVRWSTAAKAFIAANGVVDIRALMEEHLTRAIALHRWLIVQLIEDSIAMLDEYNDLIAERVAIQFGVDIETARGLVKPPVARILRESDEADRESGSA